MSKEFKQKLNKNKEISILEGVDVSFEVRFSSDETFTAKVVYKDSILCFTGCFGSKNIDDLYISISSFISKQIYDSFLRRFPVNEI